MGRKSIYKSLPDRLAHLKPVLRDRPWPVILPDDWVPPAVRERRAAEVASAANRAVAGGVVHLLGDDSCVTKPRRSISVVSLGPNSIFAMASSAFVTCNDSNLEGYGAEPHGD